MRTDTTNDDDDDDDDDPNGPAGRYSLNTIASSRRSIPRETLLATDWLLWMATERPEDGARITAMVHSAVRAALRSGRARTVPRGHRRGR